LRDEDVTSIVIEYGIKAVVVLNHLVFQGIRCGIVCCIVSSMKVHLKTKY